MPHESVPLIELLQYTIESVRLLLFSIANWQVMVRLFFLANAMFTYHDEQELHAASRAGGERRCEHGCELRERTARARAATPPTRAAVSDQRPPKKRRPAAAAGRATGHHHSHFHNTHT